MKSGLKNAGDGRTAHGPGALPSEREGHPAPPDLAARRAQLAQAIAAGMCRTDQQPDVVDLDGREALRFRPADKDAKGAILLLHGGGFRQGAPEINAAFAEALAASSGANVYVARYRLAPEHPFPAGLSDGWACLKALRANYPDAPIIVCGDSAGGGLAAGIAVLASAEPAMPIDGLVLLSPWLDLTMTADTYEANASSDPLFSREAAETAAGLYLQGEDPRHPLASPLHADNSAFPPTLITVGSGEVLLEDSQRLHAALRRAGVPVILKVIPKMDHVAVTRGLELPGARECFSLVEKFVGTVLGRQEVSDGLEL